eukprot:757771-Pleurochrysis_carterae.AAC.1
MHFGPISEPVAPLADSIFRTTSASEATSVHAGEPNCQGACKGGSGDSSGSKLTPEAGCCL